MAALQTITGLSIDSLVFDNSNFILQEIKGLESPLTRLPRYNLPGQSGAYISNALYGERAIKIRGLVNVPDGTAVSQVRNTYLANRTTLINNLSYSYDSSGRPVPRTLTITLVNGQVLTASVYVDTPLAMGFSPDQVDYEEFLITLVAPDPLLYSSTPISATITLPVGGGTAIPTPVPASLGASSGGSATMNNIGSQTTYPTITLSAPLTNPYIINQTTGKFIKLNYTISVGQSDVVIDCQNQQITQGTNDITGVQSTDSTFWSIISGNNTIAFSASGGSGNCVVSFTPSFLGI